MQAKQNAAFLCGILGCLCYGGGDWLMMADTSYRRHDAVGIHLLVLSANQWKNHIPQMDGIHQCIADLWCIEMPDAAHAGQCIPAGIHKRSDEREHGDLVCHYHDLPE